MWFSVNCREEGQGSVTSKFLLPDLNGLLSLPALAKYTLVIASSGVEVSDNMDRGFRSRAHDRQREKNI